MKTNFKLVPGTRGVPRGWSPLLKTNFKLVPGTKGVVVHFQSQKPRKYTISALVQYHNCVPPGCSSIKHILAHEHCRQIALI